MATCVSLLERQPASDRIRLSSVGTSLEKQLGSTLTIHEHCVLQRCSLRGPFYCGGVGLLLQQVGHHAQRSRSAAARASCGRTNGGVERAAAVPILCCAQQCRYGSVTVRLARICNEAFEGGTVRAGGLLYNCACGGGGWLAIAATCRG